MSVSIKYKGSEIASMTASGTKTLLTSGKYCEGDITVENTESGGGSDHTAEDSIIDGTISGAYTNDRVTTLRQYAFTKCTGLTSISMAKVTTVSAYAFQGCTGLTSVNFPKATSLATSCFGGCSKLAACDFPLVTTIGQSAFSSCILTSCNFPLATAIGGSAFSGCATLAKADFGAARTIANGAFNGCSALETLILRGTSAVCTFASSMTTLYGTKIMAGTGYIYVPSALVDSYKTANGWSSFADQIRAIEDYPEITGG